MMRPFVLTWFFLACGSSNSTGVQAQSNTTGEMVYVFAELLNRDQPIRENAAKKLAATKDRSVILAFLEALRFKRPNKAWHKAMKELTGESFGDDWNRWMEWYWNEKITPHPDYFKFKLAVLEKIDPRFVNFFPDDVKLEIRFDEILWGGVLVDGIPALTNPKFVVVSEASYPKDDEHVFGVELNGDARAYPLRIMDWHEMANDVVGGIPVSLAYCTLCGSAILYHTKVGDTTFTFGSSGLLYRSNKLMYDHQTKSLWAELYGRPLVGSLVGRGIELERFPIVRTSWRAWKTEHPETKVLSKDTGHDRDYTPGSAYGKYFESDETMFPVPFYDRSLRPKEWVYGINVNGIPRAYPLRKMKGNAVINDTLGGREIVVLSQTDLRAVRVYERSGVRFGKLRGAILTDSKGRTWRVREEYLIEDSEDGPDSSNLRGPRLRRLPGHLAYWFGWFAFFPGTSVYESN